ncbi:Bifunctional uridylyltransferase/uridylyl-removing enzyme [uncultured bacterium]|nr:Bifunctional uridylyltransferase/uridylyl-removing enzyme [uncultured bacterium]
MPHNAILDTFKKADGPITPLVKEILSSKEAELRSKHLSGSTGREICTSYTELIDNLLKALFLLKSEELGCEESMALVALGGYGRGELNVRSDIDLMLLHKGRITKGIEELTQQLLYILWDTGLDMGFSIRSVAESVQLAKDDLKTMTALLDVRFIFGDAGLYDSLHKNIRKQLFNTARTQAFINDKIEETRQRHARFGGSVYILEPNVKEGEGGLRDLHTAMWALKAKDGKTFEPFSLGLINAADRRSLEASLDYILWVRNELHFGAGRKADQLTFDHQERIASLLGFQNTEKSLAVEAFMQRYYRNASNLNYYSNLIMSRTLHRDAKKISLWPGKKVRVDRNFHISGGVLSAKSKDTIKDDPVAAMKAFEYSQAFDVEIDQATKDQILEHIENAGEGFRNSRDASDSFFKILRGKNVYKTLAEMARLRFLDSYIPEFEEISCKVQHDLYHVYTVDAHTLFAVREIERLRGQYKADFSLLSNLFEEMPNPEILYLSVLFHDIGKAHGKGHAEKGAAMVPEICRRLHISEDDTNLIKFVVKHHLLLANTAQYRDLHDDKLVIEFARTIGDIERLNLLYLLTFADVRAVGPDVWSQWKGALFQELYFKAITVLERGTFEAEEADVKLGRIKERVITLLKPDGVDALTVDEYFNLLPMRYFLSNSPDHISEHIKILRDFGNGPYSMRVRQDTFREYTEIVICTHDVHGLFSMITGVMAANGVNILGAQINTLKNGVALDILQVNSPSGEYITDDGKLKKMEADLADVVTGKVKVDTLVRKRKQPSILDAKAKPRVRTTVQVDNEVSDAYTVLDIHTQNRIGLLYDITSTLSNLGLYIYIAKISTKGDEAADIFYVKDIFGQKIFYNERLNEIADTIYKVLSGPAPEKPK